MEYEIERMQPEDVREVAALEAKIFSIPWSEAGFLSSLQSKDTLYLAVRKSGQLIGYCGLLQSFDEADITNVAVEETYRGCGIASRMLERLMELGKARGIFAVKLRCVYQRCRRSALGRAGHRSGSDSCDRVEL